MRGAGRRRSEQGLQVRRRHCLHNTAAEAPDRTVRQQGTGAVLGNEPGEDSRDALIQRGMLPHATGRERDEP